MNPTSEFVAKLKTSQIVALYNLAVGVEKHVKKFSDRATAEKRLSAVIPVWPGFRAAAELMGVMEPAKGDTITVVSEVPAVAKVLKGINTVTPPPVKKAGDNGKGTAPKGSLKSAVLKALAEGTIIKSEPATTKPVAPKPAKKNASPAIKGEPRKQNTPPHLNLRCPVCAYYAKSTPAMLKIARLKCPVDAKHGILMTAEERGETRGR